MDHVDQADRFWAFHADAVKRMKSTADRSMVFFIVLRLGLVGGSASLPALTTLERHVWSTTAAIVVAVLAGLDTQFKWGEEWRHFRSTQLTLERLKRQYEFRELAIADNKRIDGITTHEDNLQRVYRDTEEVLQLEADRFFKFRITDWKSGKPE